MARFRVCIPLLLLLVGSAISAERETWTTGKVTGRPEAPPPYAPVRVFPNAKFNHPLCIARMPGSDRLFILEQDGKISSVLTTKPEEKPVLFCDLKADYKQLKPMETAKEFEFVYGLVFHPKFETNKTCFVCYTLKGKKGRTEPFDHEKNLPDGSRVSKFHVILKEGDAPKLDVDSEEVVLTYPQGGHNGGDLHFGQDGFLYISTGDAADPNPPDPFKTGTDCSDLLASILRIDVDKKSDGKNYSIPKDNPFQNLKHDGKEVRPEVWSYGYRNPWRMSFDRKTGELWVGDVGWEAWEMVHKATKGSNHGWSVTEGRQPINSDRNPGPTSVVTPPVIELDHSQAASVNGGYVYRGSKFPELYGKYIFSDYMTKRFWAATMLGDRCTEMVDLTDSLIRSACFGEDNAGEIYFADYDNGTIHTFAKNDKPAYDPAKFPKTLGETGIYTNVKNHKLAVGVKQFDVNVEAWNDGATSVRFVALPNGAAVKWFEERQKLGYVEWLPFSLVFPKDAVLGRTLTLELEPGKSKRIETQLLHYDGAFWQAYSYSWRDDQTEADLVPADGAEKYFTVADKRLPGGKREQTWNFTSRTQCLTCHTPWAEVTLAFNGEQLNKTIKHGGADRNQLAVLQELGMLERIKRDGKPNTPITDESAKKLGKLTNPNDSNATLNDRARSYLHVNCSHCHRNGGGGSVPFELTKGSDLKNVLDTPPTRGHFGIKDARIIAKGFPNQSTLMYRMLKFGKDRMPHIGSELPDPIGSRLIWSWIDEMVKHGQRNVFPSTTEEDLGSTEKALNSASVFADWKWLHPEDKFDFTLWTTAAAKLPPGPVRELFEGYFPPTGGERKLGATPRPKAILGLAGEAEKGKAVFANVRNQCANCHKHSGTGLDVGPDLSKIGGERTREELLESILLPSRRVEAKYQSYIMKNEDGRAVTGLLIKRDAKSTTIRDAQNKEHTYDAKDIESFKPSRDSLMPSGLLAGLTPQQAADLLEFLKKSTGK